MFRSLLDKVRVQGNVSLNSGVFLKDLLPIIYTGEANPSDSNQAPYHSSGGRSLIIDRGSTTYRIKGCDPYGKLTQRVATSDKNRIEDVSNAYQVARVQKSKGELLFRENKPFGVLNSDQVECERDSLRELDRLYGFAGIENPCEFMMYQDTGVVVNKKRTYQVVFKLPNREADFRVKEFEKLLTERLDECSPDEIAKKQKNIKRLFGRFVYWAGVNTAFLTTAGLSPFKSSFVPQNWVISRYKNGYGILRVDHSGTQIVPHRTAYENLVEEKNSLPHIINEFSIFPGRVEIAANPKKFLRNKKRAKFSEILIMRKGLGVDESLILQAHQNVFNLGVVCGLNALIGKPNAIDPIREEMFQEALA